MLVGFGSLHGKFSLNSGQNFAVLVQYRVPGVVPFFEFWDSLIHLVHSEAVIELQGRNVVGLLKIMNHQEFSIVETPCALKKLLETFLFAEPQWQFEQLLDEVQFLAALIQETQQLAHVEARGVLPD